MIEQQNDLQKIAIAGFIISIVTMIIMSFWALSLGVGASGNNNFLGDQEDTVFEQTISEAYSIGSPQSLVNSNQPNQLGCMRGQENCSTSLANSGNEDATDIDLIQLAVNIPKIIAVAFQVVAMTILAPLVIGEILVTEFGITTGFVFFFVSIFLLLWQFLNAWLIVRFFLK